MIGKYGMYRLNNTMALLDAQVRGVGPDEARACRNWSNYTWHGDQAPGHPFVHGLQTSEPDFNDLANSKLTIQVGKNLVENKMPESHFFSNIMEHGGKIVTIAPEYGAPASKSDYWLPVRPGLSDTSIFLAITKILMDEGLYDDGFVKQFTDFPFLIRTDTLTRLRAKDVFPGYQPGLQPSGPSFQDQKLTAAQYERVGGDCVIFDQGRGALRAITRDDVGQRMEGFKHDTLGAVIRLSGDDARRARLEAMDGTLILETIAGDVAGLASAVETQFMLSAAGDDDLRADIRRAARTHGHLCAGVVLGVRMGRLAMSELAIAPPLPPDALQITVEVARCATDAIASVTGCSLGRGNLRVVDYGKMAATFKNLRTGGAVRVLAREDARNPDERWASPLLTRHHRQAIAYRLMPDAALFTVRDVRVSAVADRARTRVDCDLCGETIRAVDGMVREQAITCRPCATGAAYYRGAQQVRAEGPLVRR